MPSAFQRRLATAAVLLASGALAVVPAPAGRAQQPEVYVIPVHGTIDLGLAAFVERGLATAEAAGAARAILDIETFGGRVDAAVHIRDALVNASIPTTAYVDPRAISAGSLIAMSCDRIYMTGGGTIGAASPVAIAPGGGGAEPLGEKEVSYVRTEFRSTAERKGYPPLIAEAMVDKDATVAVFPMPGGAHIVPVDDIERVAKELGVTPDDAKVYSAAGKLLTLTTDDAIAVGLATARVDSVEDLVRQLDGADATIVRLQSTWSENLVRFLTHPVVSGLLLTLGTLGLILELRAPGWGIAGTLGVIALLLFFGAQYLVGLAEVEEVLLLAIGLGLLLVEFFVTPGFGLPGVLGILCIVASIYLALVDAPIPKYSWDFEQLRTAGRTMMTMIVATVGLGYILWRTLPHTEFGRSFVLGTELAVEAGYTGVETADKPELGSVGVTYTVLRPAGRVQIGDRIVDAQTEGDYLERGVPVRVIQHLGNAVVVEAVREEADV